jgi:hypothetical protein
MQCLAMQLVWRMRSVGDVYGFTTSHYGYTNEGQRCTRR